MIDRTMDSCDPFPLPYFAFTVLDSTIDLCRAGSRATSHDGQMNWKDTSQRTTQEDPTDVSGRFIAMREALCKRYLRL